MIDSLRTLFGIRKKRRGLQTTPAPQTGATIVRGNVRIKLAHACDAELWDWLLLSGWRVNSVRNDRRKYANLPDDALLQLKAAKVEQRSDLHSQLIRTAR